MWLDDDQWPYPHHPLVDVARVSLRRGVAGEEPRLEPDTSIAVEVFQLRPLTVDAFATWCGGDIVIVDGGPAVVLPDGDTVRLGDYAVLEDDRFLAEPAAGFAQRYTPAPG